jgi:NAD(P)H-hydrate repair Nnr-like enzyme with NAD(P)H-hydrate dehydratase domain
LVAREGIVVVGLPRNASAAVDRVAENMMVRTCPAEDKRKRWWVVEWGGGLAGGWVSKKALKSMVM